jgi:acetyl esterase/lipase
MMDRCIRSDVSSVPALDQQWEQPLISPNEISRRSALSAMLASVAVGCSPVGMLNVVAGRDGGSENVGDGIAFGTHPRQTLDIYAPIGGNRPTPVVMFIYGGSWNSGSRQDYAFVGRALAARGFVTVLADYRLVPEVLFPAFVEDNALALRWVRDNISRYSGDPRRITIVGHSAGAYNAVMLGLDHRFLRGVGVDPASIKAVAGLSGPYDFLPFTSAAAEAAFSRWPRLAETQPINMVRSDGPPIFLASGDADTLVSVRNTRTLAARLRSVGASVEEKIYPGIDHAGTLTPLSRLFRDRTPVLDDLVRFLDRTLGVRR